MDVEEIESLYEQKKENAYLLWEKGIEQGKQLDLLEKDYKRQVEKAREEYYGLMSKNIRSKKKVIKKDEDNVKDKKSTKKEKRSKFNWIESYD